MRNITPEEIQKRYKGLSPSVREVFLGIDTAEIIQKIGEKHKLMIDKIGEIADEAGLVILGLTHPKDFVGNLSSRLGVNREKAREIADEINEKIFQKIREELREIHTDPDSMKSESVELGIKNYPPASPDGLASGGRGKLGKEKKIPEEKKELGIKSEDSPSRTPTAGQAGFKIQDLKQDLKKEEKIPVELVEKGQPIKRTLLEKKAPEEIYPIKSTESGVSPETKSFTEVKTKKPKEELPTSLKKVEETATLPVAVGQTTSDISPFEHKSEKEEIFKSPIEKSDHEAPEKELGIRNYELGKKTEEAVKKPELINEAYKNKDPYREPIE